MSSLSLLVSPAGHVRADLEPPAPAPVEDAVAERIRDAFARAEGTGLLHLGAAEPDTPLPPVLAHFRDLARGFVSRICQLGPVLPPAPENAPALDEATVGRFILNLPPMRGGEYVDPAQVRRWWGELAAALVAAVAANPIAPTVEDWLRQQSPVWHLVGRVHFHLAENRRDELRPFAFLATYTTGVAARGKVQHAPLGQALRQYAGAQDKEALIALLSPVHRAAEQCAWVKELVESGAIYQPLAWTPAEARNLLRDLDALEAAGLIVRMPALWAERRPPSAAVQITVGKTAEGLGADALLDFDARVMVAGEALTPEEIARLLADASGLVLLRGRWVEVDRDGLKAVLDRWSEAERAHAEGLPFAEALRLLARAELGGVAAELLQDAPAQQIRVVAGAWLEEAIRGLRSPEGIAAGDPSGVLQATLRPYQDAGVRWLWWLRSLGLGGCLADDMGLGKTIQVIALFALIRREHRRGGNGASKTGHRPNLVVAPASLLGNWRAELERFAPDLGVLVAHPSETPAAALAALTPETLAGYDVVLTSYGTLARSPTLAAVAWDVVVADEAQAIKNAGTKQARAVRALRARTPIALTGTPVENRLGDLWSIFAFTNPGLLGSTRDFAVFLKNLEGKAHDAYGPLRALVRPYILRRLKTQREIIADLPDKTEVKAFCTLSRRQAALYQQQVAALARELEKQKKKEDSMARRGLVLSYLMRFKQICNHPSHWLGDGRWDPDDSGKLERLGELVDEIAQRQEKVLVFTQFKEMTEPLAAYLARRFGRPGLVLSGETAVGKRSKLVAAFAEEDGPPFFVLSLKAGGTGLNLTAASHVIHFDRWWNPAVEDQATDRAFRIGQKRNVLVHKLVCRGTLEERIDALIESKRTLSRQVVEAGAELPLTELGDDEILGLVSLDVRSALAEGS